MKDRWNLAYEINGTNCVTSLLIKSSDTFQWPQRDKIGTLWTSSNIKWTERTDKFYCQHTLSQIYAISKVP